MKLLAAPALALCVLVLAACSDSTVPAPDATITEANNKVQAKVQGMTCTGCSGEIVAAVQGIKGVTACHADPKTGEVSVALADDADVEAKTKEIQSKIASLSNGKYTINTIAPASAEVKTCPDSCTKACCADKAEGEKAETCPEGCTKACCQKA